MTLKTIMAAALTVALIGALCLPMMLRQAEPKSQIDQIEVSR